MGCAEPGDPPDVAGRRAAGATLTAPEGPESGAAAVARVLAFGRARRAACPECANIASAIGVAQYVSIADEVARWLGRGRILDWGAGWGQTSLFLRARGLDVVAYDVEDKGAATGLLAGASVSYVIAPGPTLPFGDGDFDAVLNCGVLEHVEDSGRALGELRRVLRVGGWLFTYHLPNRHAWTEWLGRRLGRFHHDRSYTHAEAVAVFERARFRVVECRPFHVLPRNVWARVPGGTSLGWHAVRLYDTLDARLGRVPGLGRLATAWALVAEKPAGVASATR